MKIQIVQSHTSFFVSIGHSTAISVVFTLIKKYDNGQMCFYDINMVLILAQNAWYRTFLFAQSDAAFENDARECRFRKGFHSSDVCFVFLLSAVDSSSFFLFYICIWSCVVSGTFLFCYKYVQRK